FFGFPASVILPGGEFFNGTFEVSETGSGSPLFGSEQIVPVPGLGQFSLAAGQSFGMFFLQCNGPALLVAELCQSLGAALVDVLCLLECIFRCRKGNRCRLDFRDG